MNIYDAVLAAADHIERNPGLYDFGRTSVPDCGTPGCALGWIGVCLGIPAGKGIHLTTEMMGIKDALVFYEACGHGPIHRAATAPAAMRLYAAKYLAKPQQQPPDWQAMAQRLASEPSIPMEAA